MLLNAKNKIEYVILAGKIDKNLFMKHFGDVLNSQFKNLKRGDISLLQKLREIFSENGIKILSLKEYLEDLITKEILYSGTPLTESEKKDIYFGTQCAKSLIKMEIGQTVVVKNGVIYAVEAIEGTDETIKRAFLFGGTGAIAVKVGHDGDSFNLEVPTIGIKTIDVAINSGMKVLAIEAHKTLFVNQEESIEKANTNGLKIVGFLSEEGV